MRAILAEQLPAGLDVYAADGPVAKPSSIRWQAFAVAVPPKPMAPLALPPPIVPTHRLTGVAPRHADVRKQRAIMRAARRAWFEAGAGGANPQPLTDPSGAAFTARALDTWPARCRALMRRDIVPIVREKPGKPPQLVDLRRTLAACGFDEAAGELRMLIRAPDTGRGAAARADEVLRVLGGNPEGARIVKTAMGLREARTGRTILVPPRGV